MGMEHSVQKKLAAMRVQQKQLQHYHNLSTKDQPKGTVSRYSKAADTIEQLVNAVNALLIDCTVAQDSAEVTGTNAMMPVDEVLYTFDHYLKDTE